MKLADYLKAEGLGDAAFAEMVQTDRSTISRVRRGVHGGSPDLQRRIHRVTRGKVTPNDLLGLYPLPAPDSSLPAVFSSVA